MLGLKRAFEVAEPGHLITILWKIDDDAPDVDDGLYESRPLWRKRSRSRPERK